MILSDRKRTFLVAALVILSLAVYLNTYQNQFAYDDKEILLNDHRLRSLSTVPALFTQGYWMLSKANIYRPLTMLSLAGNYFISGEAPWSYHVVNQVLHCFNTLLLFVFLGNFLPRNSGLRFIAAALFAVHPAATEAVDLIVGRAELLAFGCTLAAFHLHLRAERGPAYRYGSLALFLTGMLSKESAMMLPAFLLLDQYFFRRSSWRSVLRSMAGYGIVLIGFIAARYAVLGAFGPQETKQVFFGVPWSTTVLTMLTVIVQYWRIAVVPTGLQASYDFRDFPLVDSLLAPGVITSALVLVAVLTAAYLLFRKERVLSFFLLWPFVALLPVMNILVPTGVLFAVRLIYLPLAGYCVVLAMVLYRLQPVLGQLVGSETFAQRIGSGILVGLVVVFAGMTMQRNREWRDESALFQKDLARSPGNVAAMISLGMVLPPEEGIALLKKAIRLSPFEGQAYWTLGIVYERQGAHAEAEKALRRSILLSPNAEAHWALGILLSNTGRLEEAEDELREAVRMRPYTGDMYEDLAVVLYRRGENERAFAASREALRLNPGSARAHNLSGSYYKMTGRCGDAIPEFRKAVERDPVLYDARYNLAECYEQIDPAEAVRAWQAYILAAGRAGSEKEWVAKARQRMEKLTSGAGSGQR